MSADLYLVSKGLGVLAQDLGIAIADVVRRAGLPADALTRDSVRLSQEQYFALWAALEAESPGMPLPLQMVPRFSLEVFDPPVFAAVCSRDLETAAKRIARYKPLIGPMTLHVEADDQGLTIQYIWPDGVVPPPVLAAAELTFWVGLARLATRHRVSPIRIVTDPLPEGADQYAAYFGIPIERGDAQLVRFSREDAERPFLTARAGMWEVFEPELRRRVEDLGRTPRATDLVRAVLLEMLPAGTSSIDDVAAALAVSTRTLQRRLRAEATSFRDLLNETRASLARHYLHTTSLSLPEISYLVGYEEPSSFHRAFRDWTGTTPERMRSASAVGAG